VQEVIGTINELPNRKYHTIAEIEKAVGVVTSPKNEKSASESKADCSLDW